MDKKPKQNQRVSSADTRHKAAHRIDWARIEADYGTGQWTDAELCERYALHPSSLYRRMKRDKGEDSSRWLVDKSAEVARMRAALLVDEGARAQAMPSAVLAAAIAGADVIQRHRRDLGQAQDVAMRLLAELDAVSVGREQVEQLLRVVTQGMDSMEAAGLREQVKALVKLHARTASLAKLADSMQKLHTLERKAFGIEDGNAATRDDGKGLSDVERAARVVSMLERARAARAAAEPSVPEALVGDPATLGEHPAPLH